MDCANKAVRYTEMIAVGKDGQPVDPRNKGEWMAAPKKSVAMTLIDRMCGQAAGVHGPAQIEVKK
jgi:hypothetical protein